jgi:hypothetical protein
MAEPLGIVSSVIAVAELAYSSSKFLYQTIAGIRDAPEILVHLKTDVEILYDTIHSLQLRLEVRNLDTNLSESQKSNLREVKPALDACRIACDTFQPKIQRLSRPSADGHVSFWDRLKIQFQEKEIIAFQARLSSYKSTFAIALEFSSL